MGGTLDPFLKTSSSMYLAPFQILLGGSVRNRDITGVFKHNRFRGVHTGSQFNWTLFSIFFYILEKNIWSRFSASLLA